MKKILALLVVFMLIFFVGCADEKKTPKKTTTTTTTVIQKEKSLLCGEWRTEYEIPQTHELLTLVLNLNEDGTAKYRYGYYLGEVVEIFEGTWKEEDGKLYLNIYGGPTYTDVETPVSGAYDNSGVYKIELEETGLSLRQESGGMLVHGTVGKEIFFKPCQ